MWFWYALSWWPSWTPFLVYWFFEYFLLWNASSSILDLNRQTLMNFLFLLFYKILYIFHVWVFNCMFSITAPQLWSMFFYSFSKAMINKSLYFNTVQLVSFFLYGSSYWFLFWKDASKFNVQYLMFSSKHFFVFNLSSLHFHLKLIFVHGLR